MEIFDVRDRMEELMTEKGISKENLAEAMGCSRRIVTYWFSRQRAFNEDWMLGLCNALGVTPNEFFKVEESAKPPMPCTELPAPDEAQREDGKHPMPCTELDCLARLCRMDDETIRRKLAAIQKKELLLQLVLQYRNADLDSREQWEDIFGEESESDT